MTDLDLGVVTSGAMATTTFLEAVLFAAAWDERGPSVAGVQHFIAAQHEPPQVIS